MQLLRQSTAVTVTVGPILDASGAAVTTAVVGDFRLSKAGVPAVLSGATVAHDINGYYTIALTTTNSNTLGFLDIAVGNSAMSMGLHRYQVLSQNAYDVLVSNLPTALDDILSEASAASAAATSADTKLNTRPTLGQIEASTILAKEGTVGNRPTLAQIEASTVLAKEATVGNRPTLAQIEASTVLAKEATLGTRATQTSVDNKPTLAQIEASTVLAKESTLGNRPTLAQIELSTVLAKEATVSTKASQSSVDGKPTLGQIEASSILAKESTVNAVGTVASSALSGVNTLQNRITSGAASMFSDLIAMITGTGVNPKWTANALSLAPTGGGGGGTGTGARTVVINVQLSGAPVEGAKVRLTKAAESYLGTTNASGQATFNVDDGSWIVGITSPNTTFPGAVLAVSGAANQYYNLTAMAIVPSAPGGVTGYWTCLSQSGLPESGVTISMAAVSFAEHASTGLALDTTVRTTTSDANGLAQFADLIPGVRYQAWRGSGAKVYVTIPSDASSSLELNSLLGNP